MCSSTRIPARRSILRCSPVADGRAIRPPRRPRWPPTPRRSQRWPATRAGSLAELDARSSVCRACPRLVTWREEVATVKRRAFADQPYWGRPVPGWGSERPRLLIVGLAPAAHGANRTGRMFTGDRSGDQLYAALHRAGLVNQPTSVDAADGLRANQIRIVAPVRCAPPANAPTPAERDTCSPWLDAEWRLVSEHVRVIVALGGFAWQVALRLPGLAGIAQAAVRPRRRGRVAVRRAVARLLPPEPAEYVHR